MTAVILPGRGPFHRVDHDQQLHQVAVGGRADGLDDEDVPAPDVITDLHPDFPVTKPGDQGLPQGQGELLANLGGQFGIGVAGEDTDVVLSMAAFIVAISGEFLRIY